MALERMTMSAQQGTEGEKPRKLGIIEQIAALREERMRELGEWPQCPITNRQMGETKHPKPPKWAKRVVEKLKSTESESVGHSDFAIEHYGLSHGL